MNGTSGFQEVRSSTPDHQRIGSCTSNGIDSEKVPGSFSMLTISSLSPQASARSGKRFLTPFSYPELPSPWHHELTRGRCLGLSLYPWIFHREPDLYDRRKGKRGDSGRCEARFRLRWLNDTEVALVGSATFPFNSLKSSLSLFSLCEGK